MPTHCTTSEIRGRSRLLSAADAFANLGDCSSPFLSNEGKTCQCSPGSSPVQSARQFSSAVLEVKYSTPRRVLAGARGMQQERTDQHSVAGIEGARLFRNPLAERLNLGICQAPAPVSTRQYAKGAVLLCGIVEVQANS